jgi:DNA-binding response OmpR family regulator
VPALILLDLNLPKVTGFEVLAAIRDDARLANVPVIVVTSSDSTEDMKTIHDLGATAYFRKPHDLDQFMRLSDVVKAALK